MARLKTRTKKFDCVVCGGGMGGVCSAIASARLGLKTVLIQNRPVLGGNASSEIRVHIGGAPQQGYHMDARETGILEELRLEIAVRDPYNEYRWIDSVLFSYCYQEPNLTLILNTHIDEIAQEGDRITAVMGSEAGSEIRWVIEGEMFIDATGDGTIGALAGAEFRQGREGRREFNETWGPEQPDGETLGGSILFRAENIGRKIPFKPFHWVKKITAEDLRYRKGYKKNPRHERYWHSDSAGWWWVELPNSRNEEVPPQTEFHKIIYGIWDWIKNHDPKTKTMAENFEITWIGQIIGKRELRRLMGDYILKESDLVNMTIFEDQVAFGGWSMDLHPPGGFYSSSPGSRHLYCDQVYSIPFRCLYSKNISNLLLGSRCISTTHVAHGSTRLIATIGCIGQAVGTAAYLCQKYNLDPRTLGQTRIHELQQELLRGDQALVGLENQDPLDLALNAQIRASSEHPCEFGEPDRFVPIYFPMAQRFYLPPHQREEIPQIFLYLQNPTLDAEKISGGLRKDLTRMEFTAQEDLLSFTATIPGNFRGWIPLELSESSLEPSLTKFAEGGCFWIYLNEAEELAWGKNEQYHWNGFRLGFQNEETGKWETTRISHGNLFYSDHIKGFGTFCFKIENAPSPFLATMINNGHNRPFYAPNIWISAPFHQTLKRDPEKILQMSPQQEFFIEVVFPEIIEFSEIWLTFDTELNNSYPHQGPESEKIKNWPILGKSPKCIRHLDLFIENEDKKEIAIGEISENYQRRVKFVLPNEKKLNTRRIILKPRTNWGFHCFNLYELRVY